VIRGDAMFVTMTPAGAVEKAAPFPHWAESVTHILAEHRFADITRETRALRTGRALARRATAW